MGLGFRVSGSRAQSSGKHTISTLQRDFTTGNPKPSSLLWRTPQGGKGTIILGGILGSRGSRGSKGSRGSRGSRAYTGAFRVQGLEAFGLGKRSSMSSRIIAWQKARNDSTNWLYRV